MDDCCPGMWREDDVAMRFRVSLRTVRERARTREIGRKLGRVRWFTESEILQLMTVGPECSYSSRGPARRSGTCEEPSTDKAFTQAQRKRTNRVLADLRMHSKSGSPDQPARNVTPLRSAKQPVSGRGAGGWSGSDPSAARPARSSEIHGPDSV